MKTRGMKKFKQNLKIKEITFGRGGRFPCSSNKDPR